MAKGTYNLLRFCVHCGTNVSVDASFCPHCGQSLPMSPSEVRPPQAPDVAKPGLSQADEWVARGIVCNKFSDQIRCYSKALEIDPGHALALMLKGAIASGQGNDSEAIQSYDAILKVNPNYGDAWLMKGVSLYKLVKYDESILCYDAALKSNALLLDAWFLKGNSESKVGRKSEAISSYQRFIDAAPKSDDTELVRDHLMLGAIDHGETRLGLSPQELDDHLTELVRLGNLVQCNKVFDKARKILGLPNV